jgi:hypothetical protein
LLIGLNLADWFECPTKEASLYNLKTIMHNCARIHSGDDAPKLLHEKLHNVSKYGWHMCNERTGPATLSVCICTSGSAMHNGENSYQQLSSLASANFRPVSISVFNAFLASSRRAVSYLLSSPMGSTFCTPLSPNTTLEVKYGKSVMSDFT